MKQRSISFRTQLFFGILLVSLLPLLLCSFVMVTVFSAAAQQQNWHTGNAMASAARTALTARRAK